MVIRIKNLRLRAVIGINDWERKREQDLVIQATVHCDDPPAMTTDDVADTLDYRAINQTIIAEVAGSRYGLLERLAARLLEAVMAEPRVRKAVIEIDKPHALRFADSVSVAAAAERQP